MKRTLLLFLLVFTALTAFAQTALKGKVTDVDADGEALPFATVQLFKDGAFVQGTNTDLDGNYYFSNIDPGNYAVQVDYTGYPPTRIEDIPVLSGKTNVADVEVTNDGVTLTEVVVTGFKVPLIEQDNTTSGQTVTSEQIRNLPTRNINQIASIAAGASSADEGGAINMRGSRSNATDYYVDGVRVSATSVPDADIEQLQVITGGVEARYGDVTGGIISITTKGPSNKFRLSAEAETSEGLDNYGNSLVGLSVNGPIIKKNDRSILGYRLSGRYTYSNDDQASGIPAYRATDETIARLEADPLMLLNQRPFVSADFINNDNVNALETRPFESSDRINLNGKIDARLSDAIDVSLSGFYGSGSNQFTPGGWRLLNAARNPTSNFDNYRGNFRFRHRLGGTGVADGNTGSSSVIQNASYNLQFTVENTSSNVEDPIHGDNFFDYGHVGTFDIDYIPVYDFNDRRDSAFQTDYREVIRSFDPTTSRNGILSNYNNILDIGGDQTLTLGDYGIQGQLSETTFFDPEVGALQPITLDRFYTINGRTRSQFAGTWFDSNVGAVYNTFNKSDNDLYTFQANAAFEIVPGSSDKSRHSIQLGVIYEQRTNRGYGLAPRGLWTAARSLVNQHLITVDPNNRVIDSVRVVEPRFGFDRNVAVQAPTVQTDVDGQFYRSVRTALGVGLDEFVNVDGLSPDQLSLDMFSANELTFNGLVSYFGYDYLGNEFDGTFDDFFTLDENGERSFNVAPNRPIYAAAYLQDKFTINKMIFRVGVRVDRYDANTRVLKDPYSLYEILGADDFHANFGGEKPGSIGGDFRVYTDVDNGDNVVAYRNGDDWFRPNGEPVNSFTEIDAIRGNLVFPKYANPGVFDEPDFIKSDNFSVEDAFKDYEVQFNVMPRLAFSFPISDVANFFAHYDVLLQRPPSGSLATALDYYFFADRAGGSTFNNPALRPERTVDYEVGFKTGLSRTSALTIAAYYKEMRDMIQLRTYAPVAQLNSYTTFDNQDFGTVKGFSLTYDLRRTAGFTVNANYTLQFADGTGSGSTSQRGLTNRGNLRTLFPLSFDERHRVNLVIDYRIGQNTNLPGFLKNSGVNLQTTAVSGRPYTATFQPTQFGGTGTEGAINGARQPFTFVMNAQVNKEINIGNGAFMNIYFRVSNLLDRRNVLNVYSATGSPENPGYLQSEFGQDQITQISQGSRPLDSFLAAYSWNVIQPGFFTLPRRMYVGAQFSL